MTQQMTQPNWDDVNTEVSNYLVDLLRLDTTNPPGNETIAAEYLARVLRREGFEPMVLESVPGRGSVVARLPGSGAEAPLLLMCHTDVVPAEAQEWTHPPFSGTVADGFVWGRGAVDMKDTVATFLQQMLLFKRRVDAGAAPLSRDLIFMAAADEERGGELGAGWLVNNHPDLIRAEYALNEGGGYEFVVGEGRYIACQTAEKGFARFLLTSRGKPGHASIPREDNAVVRLAETVARFQATSLPYHLTETARAYITTIAADQPDPLKECLLHLLDPATYATAIHAIGLPVEQKRLLAAILHNTATPTILNAGSKVNVIPSVATAHVDGRVLPGFDRSSFRTELEPFLCEGVELEFTDWGGALESTLDSPLYDAIQSVMATALPQARLVPTMLTGGTDAKHIVRMGTKVYGFTPYRYEGEELQNLAHAHDERISLVNLHYAAQTLYQVISRFCGQPA